MEHFFSFSKSQKLITYFLTFCFLFFMNITAYSEVIKDKNGPDKVQVWFSSELLPGSDKWFTSPPTPDEIKYKLDKQDNLTWIAKPKSKHFTIKIDPEIEYQSILGIGMALEATTLYAIKKNKTEEQLNETIKAFIDPESGLGFNLFRLSIGLSDFSDGRSVSSHPKGFYSYQDFPESKFSVQRDIDLGKIEMINRVQKVASELNPKRELKFFASCWSPPAWMKTSGKLIGGTLKKGYEEELALYFRRFIESYDSLGILIHAMTIQNEPNFTPRTYPGMKLSWKQEKRIVKALFNEFHKNLGNKPEINTKLWINDHNFKYWKNSDRLLNDLSKENKKHYVDAVAFHNYEANDSISKMSKLKQKHPDIDMQITEHSEWGVAGMNNILNYFRNDSRSYMYWVAMTTKKLDEHNQSPYNKIGELSPTLLIEKNSNSHEYYASPEYYLIGQFSKFIEPGAKRIECNYGSEKVVTAVSFKNPEGQIVCITINQTNVDQELHIEYQGKFIKTILPSKTLATFTW